MRDKACQRHRCHAKFPRSGVTNLRAATTTTHLLNTKNRKNPHVQNCSYDLAPNMNWFKQAGRWLGNTQPKEHVPVETMTQHVLARLLTMAWFVEARDPYTGGHLWRVSRYARLLSEHAKFSEAEAARIGLGGFLHDLGKVGIPDAILRKTDRLTDLEYEVIKTHPDIGMRMLACHPLAALVKDAIQLHHERPDGQGYPLGLQAGSIPEVARIVAQPVSSRLLRQDRHNCAVASYSAVSNEPTLRENQSWMHRQMKVLAQQHPTHPSCRTRHF